MNLQSIKRNEAIWNREWRSTTTQTFIFKKRTEKEKSEETMIRKMSKLKPNKNSQNEGAKTKI